MEEKLGYDKGGRKGKKRKKITMHKTKERNFL